MHFCRRGASSLRILSKVRPYRPGNADRAVGGLVRHYTDTGAETLSHFCQGDLKQLRRHFLFRDVSENLTVVGQTNPPYILFSQHLRRLVDFSALDHLGLQSDPEILSAYNKALVEDALTENQNHLSEMKAKLETEIAAFHRRPACITYNHVSDVKRKLIHNLTTADDVIFYDERNENASIEMSSGLAAKVAYSHMDLSDLEKKLELEKHRHHKLIIVDCVFPFSGERMDLSEVAAVAARHDCLVVADDTYGVGCLGDTLRGSEEVLSAADRPFLLMKSLEHGTGLGTGGYLVGPEALIHHISNSEIIMDDPDLPVLLIAATHVMFQKLNRPEMREVSAAVLAMSRHVRQNLTSAGFDVDVTDHPIVTVRVGRESLACTMADQLQDAGIYCYVARDPDVPIGHARLCLSVTRHHSRDHIDNALRVFIKAGTRLKVPTAAPPRG